MLKRRTKTAILELLYYEYLIENHHKEVLISFYTKPDEDNKILPIQLKTDTNVR